MVNQQIKHFANNYADDTVLSCAGRNVGVSVQQMQEDVTVLNKGVMLLN